MPSVESKLELLEAMEGRRWLKCLFLLFEYTFSILKYIIIIICMMTIVVLRGFLIPQKITYSYIRNLKLRFVIYYKLM